MFREKSALQLTFDRAHCTGSVGAPSYYISPRVVVLTSADWQPIAPRYSFYNNLTFYNIPMRNYSSARVIVLTCNPGTVQYSLIPGAEAHIGSKSINLSICPHLYLAYPSTYLYPTVRRASTRHFWPRRALYRLGPELCQRFAAHSHFIDTPI